LNPIATYSEVRFEGSRTFSLFADRIVIRGKETLASDGETGIPLSLLEPHFDHLRIRSKVCLQGIIMAAVFFFICYVLGSKFAMTFADPILGILLMVGVAGLILAAATARKVEFVFFKNHSGVVLLTIARAGKQQDQFDSFVATLVRQIELTNGSKATG
jgi:hypothetical protein